MRYPISFSIAFKKHKYPGKLIAIEGIDGSGKTTQAKLLVEKLSATNKKVIYTKEPTDGEIGKLTRRVLSGEISVPPLALQYLFCADRAVHQVELEDYLKKGYTIITDRYFWSAVGYGISDLGGTADFYLTAFSILSQYNQFITPDYTFFLDLPVDKAFKRISKSDSHGEIYDNKKKMIKTTDGYHKLIKKFPKEFTIVDAGGDIESVNKDLLTRIKNIK